MPNEINQTSQPEIKKNKSSFWFLVIIVSVAFIAGVITMYMIAESERQDDINSISFYNFWQKSKKVSNPTPTPTVEALKSNQ